MSKYKLTFKLKQHTPIIHFQYDQHGATLRASELKPKLDKFLIEKLNLTNGYGDNETPKPEYKSWFINEGKQHLALDYKVKVKSIKLDRKEIPEGRNNQYGAFFGTIGNDYRQNPKGLSFSDKDIILEIICFKPSLKKHIEKDIISFFEITNFGTRQSKGFGSFTITKKIIDSKEIEVKYNNTTYKTYFDVSLNNKYEWFNKYKDASNQIVLLYKAIRSGINLKTRGQDDQFYFKSLMFLYAKNLNIQWEKKTIKERFSLNQQTSRPKSEPLNYNSDSKKLMKDLLGLSSEESWQSYTAIIKKKEAIFNERTEDWEEKINNLQFERFKSPILFKPILNNNNLRVYIYLNQKELDFALGINKDFIVRNEENTFHIKFPDSFSLNNFFDFFLDSNNFNIKTYVESRFRKEKKYEILKNLLQQMKNNKNLKIPGNDTATIN